MFDRRKLVLLLALSLCIILLLSKPMIVSAHANLARSDPAANAILDTPPSEVRLWFTEVPEPRFADVQLLNRDGQTLVNVGKPSQDPSDDKLLHVALPAIGPGIYTVTWRVISAVDGHATAGAFAFVIGRDQVPTGGIKPSIAATAPADSNPTPEGVVTRWLTYLAMAGLGGGFAFVPLVLQPAIIARRARAGKPVQPAITGFAPGITRRLNTLLIISWCVLITVSFMAIVLQAASSAGVDLLAAFGQPLVTLLGGTRIGLLFWIRLILLAWLWSVFTIGRRAQVRSDIRWWWLGTVLSGAIILTASLGSHAAAGSLPFLPVLADWLHLTAVGIWIGGLIALLMALITIRGQSAPLIARLVARFSQVATLCIVVIGSTGILRALAEITDWTDLLDTAYGNALLLKLVLLVPLLGLGALNFLIITRRLEQTVATESAFRPWYQHIRQTVGGEITLVTAILLITGILTSLPPTRDAYGSGLIVHGQSADLRLALSIAPGVAGLNTFKITVHDQNNRLVADAQKVALIFTMDKMGLTEAVADNIGNGQYSVQGGYTAMVGTWNVEALIRRSGQDDVRIPFSVVMAANSAPTFTLTSKTLIGIEILAVGSLALFWARRLGRIRVWAGQTSLITGWALALLGVAVTVSSMTGINPLDTIQNPIPADSISLGRGSHIYQTYCIGCHGPSGMGDGPAGIALTPPPANFNIHMSAGHSDGQLFDWISNGFPGSAMPSFGSVLSDQQRWDGLNYIKTFGK